MEAAESFPFRDTTNLRRDWASERRWWEQRKWAIVE